MRGKRLKYKAIDKINDIFAFELKCHQEIYLSKIIEIKNGFLITNEKLPDNYWNFIIFDDNVASRTDGPSIFEETYFENMKLKPSIYTLYSVTYPGYIKDYEDAWMILACYKDGISDGSIIVRKIDDKYKIEFATVYENGRKAKDHSMPYEFLDYDGFIIYNQFEYSGQLKIEHYIAYLNNIAVGVATSITNGNLMQICDVTVLGEYRKKGVGKSLIKKIVEEAPNNALIYLVTEKGTYNEMWYQKQGFTTIRYGTCHVKYSP